MAEKKNKYKENVPGTYYVDHECISCDSCKMIAPEHFELDEEDGHAYVINQPKSLEEKELCKEAMESCPVEAIGNDGKTS